MNAERLLAHYDRIADAPDAIGRLRRFILDLAVRGKLVPQYANDEPASEVLKRIAKEKARLVKQGEIRKEKALPPISDADEFIDLPRSWSWVRLGDLSQLVTSGSRDWAQHYATEGAIFVRMGNLSKDHYRLRLDHIQRVKAPSDGEGTRTRLEAGDILISITGDVGMLGLIPEGFGEAYINQHTAMIRPIAEMRGRYLAELFRSPFAQGQFNEPQRGIKNSFRLTDVTQFVVPLPPLAEQHRIVAKIDELMALCDRLEAARAEREATRDRLAASTLARLNTPDPATFQADARFALSTLPALTTRPDQIKQLRQTILNLAVRGKLVPQDPKDEPTSELLKRIATEKAHRAKKGTLREQKPLPPITTEDMKFELCKGWQWARLGVVIKLWNGFAFKSGDFQSKGVPVIRIGDLQGGEVVLSDAVYVSEPMAKTVSSEIWVPPDALLIAMSGATTGKTAFNLTGKPLLLNQRVGRIEVFSVDIYFIRLFFDTIISRNLSISFGTAIPNLSTQQINETVIPLPPLTEQHRIVAKVDALMKICDQLEANLDQTATTRRRLLDALLAEALVPASILHREEAA